MDSQMLNYVWYIMIISATLPSDFIRTHRQLYTCYWYLIQASLISSLFFTFGGIFILDGTAEMLIKVIIDTTMYTAAYVKGVACMSSNMAKLIKEITLYEADLRNNGNKRVLNVYEKIIEKSKLIQLFYIFLSYLGLLAFLAPSFVNFVSTQYVGLNTTAVGIKTPYQWWLPLDVDKYYVASYLLQTYSAFIAIHYYCFNETLLTILPLYITLRLKVLKNNLSELDETVKMETENKESMIKKLLNDQIQEHVNIISNCLLLNVTVKYITLLEFFMASVDLSVTLFQMTSVILGGNSAFLVIYISLTLFKLLLQYWRANEIREESVEIGKAAYEIRWYECSKSIKTNIRIMIMRSQKPLTLTVGPFGDMTLEMFVKLIKAVYTYLTFIKGTYGY